MLNSLLHEKHANVSMNALLKFWCNRNLNYDDTLDWFILLDNLIFALLEDYMLWEMSLMFKGVEKIEILWYTEIDCNMRFRLM